MPVVSYLPAAISEPPFVILLDCLLTHRGSGLHPMDTVRTRIVSVKIPGTELEKVTSVHF
jgi:hypothetical protein